MGRKLLGLVGLTTFVWIAGCATQEQARTEPMQVETATAESAEPKDTRDYILDREGRRWLVHDMNRPAPEVVTPGDACGDAPSDAIILFDGTEASMANWSDDKGNPSKWICGDGYMESVKKAGYIQTREEFGSCQLHVEFATPAKVQGSSQGRGNSGVFLQGQYEVQVLDSYNNKTYADGQAGAIYGQHPPLVNACRPPGQWQTYDIIWHAPRFKEGKLERPATVTVFHNGVLVQDHWKVLGETFHKRPAAYRPHPPEGSIVLQDHGNPIRFRNIWYRPLSDYDAS